MPMLKSQAKKMFKECAPHCLARKNPSEIRMVWNGFVDQLQKEGKITESQAFRWVNPFLAPKDR